MNSCFQKTSRHWPLFMLLAAFYFLPYSAAAPTVRQQMEFFSIYHRLGGLLSVWDLLLAFTFFIVLVRGLMARSLRFTLGRPAGAGGLAAVMILSFAIGLLHVEGAPLGYGTTEAKRAIIALLPIVYLSATYVLVINSLVTGEHARQALRWLSMLTIALVCYGVIRFGLILAGVIDTMRPFGLPIVLYDQMTMLYPFLFALPALRLMNRPAENHAGILRWFHWLLWSIAVLLILVSARRFNYILLAAGLLLVLIAGPLLQWWQGRQSLHLVMKTGVAAILLILLLKLILPESAKSVAQAIQSLDMTSETGLQHGGNIRQAEIRNMFANMERRPYSYLIGMGLGTKWQEIEEQPLDSFSYPKSYLALSRGWFPQFHLPYLALLYRLGILGLSALLVWLVFYIRGRARDLCPLHAPEIRALGLGMLIFLTLNLPNLGDSANPTAAILCGICMGILERLTS